MAEGWNLTTVEMLDDSNYFLWKEKIESILRAKRLWKKVIERKQPEKPDENDAQYATKYKEWDDWDDDNSAARAIMINTMTKAQVLRYCNEKNAQNLWTRIKLDMAAQSQEMKGKALMEVTNLKMKNEESVDEYLNKAEALRNQCAQFGKTIEEYELKMYILKGLRKEFEQSVRILESQRHVSISDMRFALKQEETRRENKGDGRIQRETEGINTAKEKSKGEVQCYNCGKRGHMSKECYGKQKCFNCQGFGHISTACKETRYGRSSRGRGQRGGFQKRTNWKDNGHGRNRDETMMRVCDESMMNESKHVYMNNEIGQKDNKNCMVKNVTWLLDSGSTSHMTCDSTIFDKLKREERRIRLADKEGRDLTSKGIGEIVMKQKGDERKIRLMNVLHVPDINTNLLSVNKLIDHGYIVKFERFGAAIYKNSERFQMKAERRGDAYYVETSIMNDERIAIIKDEDTWHKRLGHVNKKTISEMMRGQLVKGMRETDKMNAQCEGCVEGKTCRKVHAKLEKRKTNDILQLWHMDLIGPVKPISKGGKRYIFTIIDDHSRMSISLLLKEKSETAEELKKMIILKENQTGKKLKSIRSDNGGEFIGTELREWLESKGIKHELSPPRTPQCNGVAERGNRTLIEMTRAMMSDSRLPMEYWAEAVCTASHIKNRIKSSVHGKTPYEIWHKRKPNIGYMKRFGCTAYMLQKDGTRYKFEPKTIKGIFLGYSRNNTYKVYLPQINKVRCDCDVKFDEKINGAELLKNNRETSEYENSEFTVIGLNVENGDSEINQYEDIEDIVNDDDSLYEDATMTEVPNEDIEPSDSDNGEDTIEIPEESSQRRGKGRPRGITNEVMKVRRHIANEEFRNVNDGVRRSERIKNRECSMMTIDREVPKNLKQAKRSKNWKNWREAMDEEMNSIIRHRVWDIVARPKDHKVINSKWVYNVKEDASTKTKVYKARLVAVGCGQRQGYDYFETYAPVVRTETLRLLFSISAEKGRNIKSYDVKTAFLHGNLEEEVYMKLPEGYETNDDKVCKLKRSIYGLKQAGRCWNQYLTKVFIDNDFKQSKEDPCLFFIREKKEFLFCGVHVDDMIVISSSDKFENQCMKKLEEKINLKNMGEAKNILGLQVEQKKGEIKIHLKDYIKKLLQTYGMEECNTAVTPLDLNVKLDNNEESQECNKEKYLELIGRLMYVSVHARPDIAYAMSCLSQFNKSPKMIHMTGLKRVLRYLKGTINYCLVFRNKRSENEVKCECDASWDSTSDAKSFTGLLVYHNDNVIHWRSKKQSTVALSSTESEIEGMLEGVKEVVWLCDILCEIGMGDDLKRVVKCDNLNAVRIANGGDFKTKSKLMNRKCHYIKETVMRENLKVSHVASKLMTADCLTKAVSGVTLLTNVKKLMDVVKQ